MDIQWGWKEDNGENLGDQGSKGLPTIPDFEERVWSKENKCFIDIKKNKVEYVLQQLHVFDEKVNFTMRLFYLLGSLFIATKCFC